MLSSSELRERKESVLAGTDIVELIGQTVQLKRSGKDFSGLCPFHQERTPSFHVSPSKRFFHCFGCQAHGNAIDFVMKRDRVEFAEALRRLNGGYRVAPSAMPPKPAVKERPKPRMRFDLICPAQIRAVNPTLLDQLSRNLGVTAQSLVRLDIGWAGPRWCGKCSEERNAWSFPMIDVAGCVRGVRLRFVECGHKSAIAGGREGLFVPSGIQHAGRLFICEGPTDTAALLDLNLLAIGRPSCRGGVSLIVDLLKAWHVRELVIFADRDRAGQEGAAALASRSRLFCQSVRIITPPDGVKDARQWKQNGATPADVVRLVRASSPIKLVIKSNSTSGEGVAS